MVLKGSVHKTSWIQTIFISVTSAGFITKTQMLRMHLTGCIQVLPEEVNTMTYTIKYWRIDDHKGRRDFETWGAKLLDNPRTLNEVQERYPSTWYTNKIIKDLSRRLTQNLTKVRVS